MAATSTIKVRGKTYPILDQISVHGRKYSVLQKLNRGTSQKHLAWDHRAGRHGALRLLYYLPKSNRFSQQTLKLLERFSKHNSLLPHIYDFLDRKNEWLLVTNWLEGITLRDYLQQAEQNQKPWPSTYQAFTLFCKFSHALTKCHRKTMVVLWDLKPENLLLTSSSNDLTMIDFGSSWTEESPADRAAGDGFNAAYAAPERSASEKFLDQRVDLYAVHVMLYELFTGALPFDNLGGKAGWPQYREQAPALIPAFQQLRGADGFTRSLWKELDSFLSKGLQFDSLNRHPSASLWLEEWNRLLTMIKQQAQKRPWNHVAYQFMRRWLLPK